MKSTPRIGNINTTSGFPWVRCPGCGKLTCAKTGHCQKCYRDKLAAGEIEPKELASMGVHPIPSYDHRNLLSPETLARLLAHEHAVLQRATKSGIN